MNPTRKERMDAAANLMEIPYTGNDSYTAWLYVADALNIDDENALLPGGWRLIVSEMAGLIDQEPERTCRIEQISETEMRCSACGYLYDWMDVDYLGEGKLSYDGDYCKGCGAKVVS